MRIPPFDHGLHLMPQAYHRQAHRENGWPGIK